jgi:hypothetical protein
MRSCDGSDKPIFPLGRGKCNGKEYFNIQLALDHVVRRRNASSNPVAASKTPPAAIASTDTVKLTESQQVHQLYDQGQGVSQIASGLSLRRCCE